VFSSALVEHFLDTAPVARLAQIDPDGQAHALPFVFARIGRSLWSPVDGKPKRHARLSRLNWIGERPEVCVLVDEYVSDWTRLWWLKVFCRAEVVRGEHRDWHSAETALAEKYPQYGSIPMFAGEPTMVRFEIVEWRSWAAAGDAALEQGLAPR